jgi:KAP family P-loop domain.
VEGTKDITTDITKVILEYVSQEQTNYAILINGKWGTGKTYLWDNVLKKEIESKTSIKPLYTSLYGVNSLDDVSQKLFFAAKGIDFIDEKTSKSVFDALKLALKWVNKTPVKFEIKVPYDKMINFKKYVICFDDLERSNIDIRELLGYITNLTERNNVKVVILGCEREIENFFLYSNLEAKMEVAVATLDPEDKADPAAISIKMTELFGDYNIFKKIKEKLIGKTIEYQPDYKIIISSIIEYFDGDYKNFLEQNCRAILEVFYNSEIKNIRILKHALNEYRNIYNAIKELKLTETDDVEAELLIFHIASSLEILSGNYSKEDALSYNSTQYIIMEIKKDVKKAMGSKDKEVRKPLTEFLIKYFPNTKNSYHFMPSIWKYIVNGILDKDQFGKEVRDVFPKEKLKNALDEFLSEYWKLSDAEFQAEVSKILQDAENGILPLNKYIAIFIDFENFINNKAISLNNSELLTKIKGGMDIAAKVEIDAVRYEKFNISDEENMSDGLLKIKKHAIELNEMLKRKLVRKELEQLTKALVNNDIKEFRRIISSENNNYYPIMGALGSESVCKFIKESTNENIVNLNNLLWDRYSSFINISEYYKGDIDALREILEFLNHEIDIRDKAYNLKNYLLRELRNTVKFAVELLEK